MAYFDVKTKNDLVNIKKRLRARAFQESYRDYAEKYNMEKYYAPLISPMKDIVAKTDQSLKSLEAIKNKEPIILPSIQQNPDEILAIEDIPEEANIKLGKIATKYLSRFKDHDKTYGLKLPEDDSIYFKIGNEKVEILGNDLVIKGRVHRMNENIWKLLMLKDPGQIDDYNESDLTKYYNIMIETTPFLNDKGHIISSKAPKYNNIMKSIITQYKSDLAKASVEKIKKVQQEQQKRRGSTEESEGPSQKMHKTGEGFNTVFLPSDINKLVDRHRLLLSALKSGNTGVFNELQAINDVLLEKQILTSFDVNKLSSLFSL